MTTLEPTRPAMEPTLVVEGPADVPYDPDATVAEPFVVDEGFVPPPAPEAAPRRRGRWIVGATVASALLFGAAAAVVATEGPDGAEPADAPVLQLPAPVSEEEPVADAIPADGVDAGPAVTPSTSPEPEPGDQGGTDDEPSDPGGEQPPPVPDPEPLPFPPAEAVAP